MPKTDHYETEEKLASGMPHGEAYELKESSRLDAWPPGTKCAVGRSGDSLSDAYAYAVDAFTEHFGRSPVSDRVIFRGAFMTFSCMIEIGETPA